MILIRSDVREEELSIPSEGNPYLSTAAGGPMTSVHVLAERLRGEILTRRPKPGTYLFAVSDLVRDSGYGPSVVREALQQIASAGLIDVRRGPKGGVYARRVGPEVLTRSLNTLVLANGISRADLIEARLEIEGLCARLAASNAMPEDIQRLEDSLDRTRALTDDSAGFARENVVFHLAVAHGTRNDVIIALAQSVRDLFFEETTVFDYVSGALVDALRAHERLVDAIKKRDAELAVRLMCGHISAFNEYVSDSGQMASARRGAPRQRKKAVNDGK